jgi:hypothetical protein
MAAPYSTVALNSNWDIYANASGNIATLVPTAESAAAPLAQDVASAVLTFFSEVYYDDTLGVQYTRDILGKNPPLSVLNADISTAAETVPYVASAQLVITRFVNRQPKGQIQFTDEAGNTGAASF